MIFGTVHRMLPTFTMTGMRSLPDRKVAMEVYTGDVANRGKGTLMVAHTVFPSGRNPDLPGPARQS